MAFLAYFPSAILEATSLEEADGNSRGRKGLQGLGWVGVGCNRASGTWTRVNTVLAILVHTRECFRHTMLLGGARRHLRWRCRRVARVIHDNWKSCLHVSTVVLRQLNLSSTHPVSASGILYLSAFLKGRQASRKEHRYLASWEETPLLEKPYESFLFAGNILFLLQSWDHALSLQAGLS